MILCPVCEHSQSRVDECENCGKRLSPPHSDATPVTRLPELQQTRLMPALPQVPDVPMPELDLHRVQGVPALPSAPVPELEPTRHRGVPPVAAQAFPEFASHRVADAGAKTAPPMGAVTCRYCRNVQATGLLCDRCGMRLPRVRAQKAATQKGRASEDETGYARCLTCRQPGRVGTDCRECGTAIVATES